MNLNLHAIQMIKEGKLGTVQGVINDQEPKSDGEEGHRDMKYISEVYKSCRRQTF